MSLPPIADDLLPGLLALADQPRDGDRARSAIRLLSAITLAAIVTIIGVGLVAMMLIRRHRRKLAQQEGARRARNRPPTDPWFESARRVPDPPGGPKSRIIPMPGPDRPEPRRRRPPDQSGRSDDDTVDLDPDELHERDVEGDDDDVPPEPPPPPTDPPGPAGPGSRGG